MFGLPKENVRVITKFVGSGFGGKLWPWTHCPLAAAAARQLGKPVKLVRQPQDDVPDGRPSRRARSSACASARRPTASSSRSSTTTSTTGRCSTHYHEDCGEATPFQYSVPNLRVTFGRARRNIGATADMRGPGAVPGLYATESAMNELADQLKIDPVKLRILNEPKIDESTGHSVLVAPFARVLRTRRGEVRLVEAHARGRLDEARRPDARLGHGRVLRGSPRDFAAEASVQLRDDGTARVACGTQDIGTGTYTILAQLAVAEDRRAARQGRSRARRYVASGRPDLGRLDGDRLGGPGRLRGGRQRDRIAADHRDDNARARRSRSASPTIWRSKAAGSS